MEPLTASTHEEEPGNVAPRGSSMPFASSALRWGCRGAAREEEVAGGSRREELPAVVGGRGCGPRGARWHGDAAVATVRALVGLLSIHQQPCYFLARRSLHFFASSGRARGFGRLSNHAFN